ncbi:MAG: twin-arginine translocase TatA/TatE family subunit [Microthrixaceae bacterium]|nr:twin-arginine translocase TatA/TatE family subunit [Microthrixaceae bacterium]
MPASHTTELFGLIVENIGGGELLVILLLALVVLGPDRIPEMAKGAGRLIHKVKSMSSEITGDMTEVINDPSMQPIRELGEFATRPRQKLAEYALEAEAEERRRKAAQDAEGDDGAADTAAPAGDDDSTADPDGPGTATGDGSRSGTATGDGSRTGPVADETPSRQN